MLTHEQRLAARKFVNKVANDIPVHHLEILFAAKVARQDEAGTVVLRKDIMSDPWSLTSLANAVNGYAYACDTRTEAGIKRLFLQAHVIYYLAKYC